MLTTEWGNVSAPLLMNVDDRMGECALPVLMMFENRRREWCGPVLMVFNDQTRECACPRPVGTRGGCRAGWGPCACPDGNAIQWGLRGAQRSHPHEDKHKAQYCSNKENLSVYGRARINRIERAIAHI